jgi:hypothetical protein
MNNFNYQVKFILVHSYMGSAHAILSPSDNYTQ